MNSEPPIPHNEGKKESDEQGTSPSPNASRASVERDPQVFQHGHYGPRKKGRDGWDKLKYVMELVGIAAVIFYTVFAGCQVRVANRTLSGILEANNLTRSHFRRQMRPFLRILDVKRAKDGIVAVTRNYGATPAIGILAAGHARQDIKDLYEAMHQVCTGYEDSLFNDQLPKEAVFPNEERAIPVKIAERPQQYLAICVSYQDIEGGFWYTPVKGNPYCATYNLVQLYAIKASGIFELITTSVQTAQPPENNDNSGCYQSKIQQQ